MSDIERETAPPPHLKRRVIGTLRERGLLREPWHMHPAVRAAAAVVLFATGFASARLRAAIETEPGGTRWLLLLYEDSTFAPQAPISDLVAEYTSWADGLREEGKLVAGEKLGESGRVLEREGNVSADRNALGMLAGLFIVAAPSEAEALAIARTCPHLRHGGRVVLRPIESTGD